MACVGAFYEKMGRMLGSSFPDTINNLLKALKSAEVGVTFEDSTFLMGDFRENVLNLLFVLLVSPKAGGKSCSVFRRCSVDSVELQLLVTGISTRMPVLYSQTGPWLYAVQ